MRFDRFSRSVSDLVRSLEEFCRLGVAFVSIHEQIETSSPTGHLSYYLTWISSPLYVTRSIGQH
jgi:DNA invertase Pin-like site-specific DNA recombinase